VLVFRWSWAYAQQCKQFSALSVSCLLVPLTTSKHMADFESVSLAEVKVRTGRKCKTAPLREAVAALQVGDAFFVPYSSEEVKEGYRPSTVTQVVGTMSRANPVVRYSVRRDAKRAGCFVVCVARPQA
jgi:hypothetical protein